jgi:hypothetical protein
MHKGLGIGMVLISAAFSGAQAQYSGSAAPVVQAYPQQGYPAAQAYPGSSAQGYGVPAQAAPRIFDLQPNAGVSVRSDVSGGVETVSATNVLTELRLTQGRADVAVHHPADHSQILVDLPNGQVALLKDGLYTFNAGTNTVRVLHGEAEAYNTPLPGGKGTKVKETQELTLVDNFKLKAVNAYPYELTADLVGGGHHGDGAYGGYEDGFDGPGPYYAGGYGYPWGYGFYPYGYGFGYPIGVGFGFGYRGGFGGGFHGGGFHR